MFVPDQKLFHSAMRKAVCDGGFTLMMCPLGSWGFVPVGLLAKGMGATGTMYEGKACECPRYLVELLAQDGAIITCKQKLEDIDYTDFCANFKWAARQLPSAWPMGTGPYRYMLFWGCAVDSAGIAEFDFSCAYSDLSDALSHARRNKTTRYVWDQVDKKAINLCDEEDNTGPVMFPQ